MWTGSSTNILTINLSSFKFIEEEDKFGDAWVEESRLRLSDSKDGYSTPHGLEKRLAWATLSWNFSKFLIIPQTCSNF